MFKRTYSKLYRLKIKKEKIGKESESFVSLAKGGDENYLFVTTAYGVGEIKHRIHILWVTDQNYIYSLGSFDLKESSTQGSKEGFKSSLIGVDFYRSVQGFPVFYGIENHQGGALHSFYYDGRGLRRFKAPIKGYHRNDVYQLLRFGGFLWSVDSSGMIKRLSLAD